MALSIRLQARQSQSLVMTPQLMQSIRLLQMTRLELETFIDSELERNPLLEREDADSAGDAPGRDIAIADSPGDTLWTTDDMPDGRKLSETLDTDASNITPDEQAGPEPLAPDLSANWKSTHGDSGGGAAGHDAPDFEDVTAAKPTLRDHVDEQVRLLGLSVTDRLIAADLTDQLDESGYCRIDSAETAERLGIGHAQIEAVFSILRGLEPAGLFAIDLADCLALQLQRQDRLDPAMAAFVSRLDLLARRDFASLKRICGVDEDDLLDMLAELQKLDPKPGAAFSVGNAEPVVPDVVITLAPDGSWAVDLNPEALPRVLVNQSYHARVLPKLRQAEDKAFVSDCLQSANWLVRSLDQRARTILKVTSEIVRQQDAFFLHGISKLRPLNLKTVADAIGMHESTVSRVTSNKFVMTPRGMFELRFFFTVALASAEGGDAHSAEAVKHQIRDLIDAEPPAKVLSDDAIVQLLQASGVDIARRTVAKYREGMNIASSVQRRREKMAIARQNA
jgi:RNA polymerase sigma-54 factor